MYEAYFSLSRRPFVAVPQVDHYYPGAAIEAARQTLARSIERAEGVGMVVGPSGTGKTLLSLMLAKQFEECFKVALLSSGRLSTRRALLQAILFELGQPYREMDEGELRLALVDHLTLGDDCPQGMLLLVDEAHTLPLRLLEEIRMITNLVTGGEPRTRLVLAGGAVLEERLASPRLESFSQRIVARCYLESFNREETQAYIHAEIGMAGREGEQVISHEACHAVYQATDGVPRLVNQVCDHALLLACAAGHEQVGQAVVEEAWADLQQLPTPWNGDSGEGNSEGSIVEFGGLEDESEEIEKGAGSHEPVGDEAESVPMLRISPESEEPRADPVRQVERIEHALTRLDDDFQPAGSIGPELELVFDDPQDPFSEEFEEEEVIVDRYEAQAAADGEGRPHTVSEEGPEGKDHAGFSGKQPALADHEEGSPESRHALQSRQPALASGDASETVAAETQVQNAQPQWHGDAETVPMPRRRPVETAEEHRPVEPEEEEMIIVEEGYDDSEPVHPRPAITVRRQQYGQLFAGLRRGR